jgi:ATP-dependent DNA helicase RecG
MREDSCTEFKSSFSDAVIETLTAFANTKGGKVLIGIDDMGKPVHGFSLGHETLQKWVNEVKNKTQPSGIPDAEVVEINGKMIGQLSIKEFPVKPVAFRGRYFRRIKNSNHQLNPTEISDLHLQSLQLSWDSYPYQDAQFEDLNEEKISLFIKKVNDGGRFVLPEDPYKAMLLLKLIKKDSVTNAAMILFSKANLFYNVHVGRFKTPSLIIDERLINGNLFDVVDETARFINSHLKVAFEITGITTQRTEIIEYPIAALRELILNSLIHRDYASPSDVQIKIFDQKISFFNPGGLYGNISVADLKKNNYTSELRNKLLAEAFYLTKDIEKYGTGFLRIREAIKAYPTMKFRYKEQGNGFIAELSYTQQKISTADRDYRKYEELNERFGGNVNEGLIVNEGLNEGLSEGLKSLLATIRKNPGIQAKDLSPLLENRPLKTIERQIKELVTQQFIERRGSRKTGGYWVTLKNLNKG